MSNSTQDPQQGAQKRERSRSKETEIDGVEQNEQNRRLKKAETGANDGQASAASTENLVR